MRSLRAIKKSISHAKVESKHEADEAVLQHLLAELARLTAHEVPQAVSQPREGGGSSAADLLTVGCLNAAFRRGGLEAVDRQCEMAAQRLGTWPERISVRELIQELNL